VAERLGLHDAPPEPIAPGLSSNAWRIRVPGGDAVLRMPVDAADGVGTYPMEHALLAALTELGAPVPAPIQGSWQLPGWPLGAFSLTSLVPGIRLRPESASWAAPQVATFLHQLHSLPIKGHGPLADHDGRLAGIASGAEDGLRAAFANQPLWPFGGASLAVHPALADRPELIAAIAGHAPSIRRAALNQQKVIVHSDLHEENILEAEGRLEFIDFGECFAGAPGWDFAALAYFGGWPWAERILEAYRARARSQPDADDVAALALSFGLYRWQQDRRLGVDGDAHDEGFLLETLARLGRGPSSRRRPAPGRPPARRRS